MCVFYRSCWNGGIGVGPILQKMDARWTSDNSWRRPWGKSGFRRICEVCPNMEHPQNPKHGLSLMAWLVVWNIFYFSIYWEFHHPNWRTHIFQRGRYTTNQWLMKNCTLLCWFAPFLDKSKWSMLGIHFWRYLVPCAEGAAYRLVMFFPHWTTPCRGAKCGHLPMWGKRQRKTLVGYLSGGFLKLQMDANGEIMYNLRFCQPWKCPEHMGFLYQWATGTAPR